MTAPAVGAAERPPSFEDPTVDERDSAIGQLYRQAILRLLEERGPAPVVLAACGALSVGLDGEQLRILAAVAVDERAPPFGHGLDGLVSDVLRELEWPIPNRGTVEAAEIAVALIADDVLRGALTPRQFTSWVHHAVGHAGPATLQPLVELDDRYDTVEWTTDHPDELDADVLALCRGLDRADPDRH